MGESIPLPSYRITDHARLEMTRRQVTEDEMIHVLTDPEQVEAVREGRMVYQSRFQIGEPPRDYLLRIVVDIDHSPPAVVTVYRTSKVAKYWRTDT